MAKPLTVKDFFKRFPDDDTCLQRVMDLRYGRVRDCLGCAKPTEYYRLVKRPAYSCKLCGHHIYPCAGTPFERTRTPLQLWFYAIYLFTTTRHGVPAKELQRQLGVTYKTAWRIAHTIRQYIGIADRDDGLSGQVERHETCIDGKPCGIASGAPNPKDLRQANRSGTLEWGGTGLTRVIPHAKQDTSFQSLRRKSLRGGGTVSTDPLRVFKHLNKLEYQHASVNDASKQRSNGSSRPRHRNSSRRSYLSGRSLGLGVRSGALSYQRRHPHDAPCSRVFRHTSCRLARRTTTQRRCG
jgi:hypothetical protein